MQIVCMKFQTLFSGKTKKNIILLSAESAKTVIKMKEATLQTVNMLSDMDHLQFPDI